MDPLTIAASIGVAKKVIEGAVDLKDCGSALSDLFSHAEQHEKNKREGKRTAPKTRNQQIVRKRLGEDESAYTDDTSLSSTAADILQEKQNELAMQALAKELDRKWGEGTWELIQSEHKKRVQAKKDREAAAKKARADKAKADKEFLHKVLVEGGKVAVVITVIGFMIWFLWWAAQRGGSA